MDFSFTWGLHLSMDTWKKHVSIGCKHYMSSNQTPELLKPISMFCCYNLKELGVSDGQSYVFNKLEIVLMFVNNYCTSNSLFKASVPLCQPLQTILVEKYTCSLLRVYNAISNY